MEKKTKMIWKGTAIILTAGVIIMYWQAILYVLSFLLAALAAVYLIIALTWKLRFWLLATIIIYYLLTF